MSKDKLLVYVVGPTAIGKTGLTIKLAEYYKSEILSADSRQFYREMNIGTAKPSEEELSRVIHHFINSHSIKEEYNVSEYENDALHIIDELFQKKDVVFVTGGSGLYLHSLWHGFSGDLPGQDEELRNRLNKLFEEHGIEALQDELNQIDPDALNSIDENNPVRIMRAIEIVHQSQKPLSEFKNAEAKERPFEQLIIGLEMDREMLYQRINDRVDQMINNGLEDEAKSLYKYKDKNALKTVGYQELFRYFAGEITVDEAIEKIKVNSRRYAKRQITWFKRYPEIEWFSYEDYKLIIKRIDKIISE